MDMDPILMVLALLAAKEHLGKGKATESAQPKGPQIPPEVVRKVADIVATRLTSGTMVPSARIVDDIVKLLTANPGLTAKLVMVYQSDLQGESDNAQHQ